MSYLTAEDQKWVKLHTSLAKADDFEQFSKLLLTRGAKRTKPKRSVSEAFLEDYCRPAVYDDFAKWSRGYSAKGGKFEDTRSWELFQDSFYVLEKMPEMIPGMYGADSFDLIIPKHIDIRSEQINQKFHGFCGHNKLFFMKKFVYFSVFELPINYRRSNA